MVDKITTVCMQQFPAHSGDCSGFVQAVGAGLGVTIQGQANQIVDTLRAGGNWVPLADGPTALASARAGKLVIAGLRGDEQTAPDAHGHVVVVVDGPTALASIRPPTGVSSTAPGRSARRSTGPGPRTIVTG
jgi:hypothetical protein